MRGVRAKVERSRGLSEATISVADAQNDSGRKVMFDNMKKTANHSILLHRSRCAAQAARMAFVLALSLGLITVSAATKDRTRPTTPGNFRVTGKTAYTVTVAWSPSSDNSGNFSYHLSGAYHVTPVVLPKTATSHTFTALAPGNEYWFFLYAKDAAGNVSGQANL